MAAHAVEIDPYAGAASPLHRWDPRAKLVAMTAWVAVLAMLRTLPAAATATAAAVCLLAAARLPLRFCVRRVALVGLFVVPIVVLLPILGSGPVVMQVGPFAVHAGGLDFAGLIALRATAIILSVLVMLHTAPLADTLWAAQSLGVPRPLVQLALLTLRYLPLLSEQYAATTTAAACRGFAPHASVHGYRTLAHLAGATFARGYRRADRVWQAMACRGFAGRLYPLRAWALRGRDVVAAVLWIVAAAALLGWDRWAWIMGH